MNQKMLRNRNQLSSPHTQTKQKTRKITNNSKTEYEYLPSLNDQQALSRLVHFIQANIPPLSNYEQKQIAEGLLNHDEEKSLTLDDARTFAMNKAIEIGKIDWRL